MTVEPHAGSGTLANPDDFGDVGLEDVGVGDVIIPRLRIIHDEAVFENNLTKDKYESLDVILLGLVKQRIMWDDEVGDGDKPMCKSPDFEHGFPLVRDDVPKDKQFPWEDSNFNPADFPPEKGINEMVTLPCASCVFKEWDKNGWKNPPCAEQHTFPLLFSADQGESWSAALFTVQKTGIKPSRQYISFFSQSKTPMFTVHTELSLTLQKRGSVKYSVPVFKRKEATEREQWSLYGEQYRTIREFIRSAPRKYDEDDDGTVVESSSNENTAPAAEPEAKKEPVSTPAPAPAGDDDDLPF